MKQKITLEDFFDENKNFTIEKVLEWLKQMENATLDDIDVDQLKTYDEFNIDIKLPNEERLLQFLLQGGNPYFGKTKSGVVVKRVFNNESELTCQDCFIRYLERKLKEIYGE